MRSMRELEPEHIPPESERPFKVLHGDAGVIGGDDAKGLPAHVVQASFKSASLRFQMLLCLAPPICSPRDLIWSAIFSGKPANHVHKSEFRMPVEMARPVHYGDRYFRQGVDPPSLPNELHDMPNQTMES